MKGHLPEDEPSGANARFEAVIFDFGGVFTTSPVQNFAAFEREHKLPERFIGEVIKTNINDNA